MPGPLAAALSGPAFDPGPIIEQAETRQLELRHKRLEEIEADAIRDALTRTDGNKRRAAVQLGIALKTLYNKLHRYRIAGFGEDA